MEGKSSFEDAVNIKIVRIGNDAFDEPLNINLSNHDLNPIEDFKEALKNEIITFYE